MSNVNSSLPYFTIQNSELTKRIASTLSDGSSTSEFNNHNDSNANNNANNNNANIKNICIDLNINFKIVSLLEYLQREMLVTFTFMQNVYLESLENEVIAEIGHSNSFAQIFYDTFQKLESITSFRTYLDTELSDLSSFTLWKTISNRGINYENESGFLRRVIDDVSLNLLLPYRQFLHYFSSMWVQSPLINYSSEEAFYDIITTDSNEIIGTDIFSKGIFNYMTLKKKKDFFRIFLLNKDLFKKVYSFFNGVYSSITLKNENLDEVRETYIEILLTIQLINLLFEDAENHFDLLISEEMQEFIIKNPKRSEEFRLSIVSISNRLFLLHSKIKKLLSLI